ncbi:glycosyltransferase family 2 protein [Candidatus Woesearchaeota archaeon]|jgi:glycosyltransferase involved in cell wall biosynthesis|nr:glycosyltransferase family 2 protein [Candidatus Woesearchaeota archaeon]
MNEFVVIPAHNEENNVVEVINKVKSYVNNIIVVDDGSTDNTYDKAKEKDITVLKHEVNLGKGAALKTGCDFALKQGAEKIVVIDADGQHNPKEIPKFLEALNDYEIVFSHRTKSKAMPFVLKFGNNFINKFSSFLFGVNIKDNQCGYRAFTSDAYKKIRWSASDYYMETEMIINTGKHKLKYIEIPIETIYADKYKGTTVLDGVKIVLKMLTWRLLR